VRSRYRYYVVQYWYRDNTTVHHSLVSLSLLVELVESRSFRQASSIREASSKLQGSFTEGIDWERIFHNVGDKIVVEKGNMGLEEEEGLSS
jgi:hypothetical protein